MASLTLIWPLQKDVSYIGIKQVVPLKEYLISFDFMFKRIVPEFGGVDG